MKTLTIATKEIQSNSNSILINLSATNLKFNKSYVVNSFEEASALQTAFIGFFDLGMNEYTGGLLSETHTISYNGRVWLGNKLDITNRQEIEVNKSAINDLVNTYFKLLEKSFN